MANIYFFNSNFNNQQYINTGTGGIFMRTIHPVTYINNLYNNNKVYYANDNNLLDIKNSFIIFIKDEFFKFYEKIKIIKNKNNNKIIIDVIDWLDDNTYDIPNLNAFINDIDAFICLNNFCSNKLFNLYNKPTYIIKHHHDMRLYNYNKNNNTQDELNILFNGYIGHANQNCLYLKELDDQKLVTINSTANQISLNMMTDNFNCHISIRKENSWEYNSKPCIKMKTAATMNCNIITTNDVSVHEMLKLVNGLDYPYLLTDSNYESVIEMINYAKKTYKTEVWYKGLDIMKRVYEYTAISNIVNKYYIPFCIKINDDFNF